MSTPIQEEFGPGYDYPNRKFHIWAVILPTVLITALAVVLMRHAGAPSSGVVRSPVVACPKQMCPPPGSTDSAKATQKAKATSARAAGLSATETTVRDLSLPTVSSTTGGAPSQPSSPSPSSNLSPTKTSLSPSSSSGRSATPVLGVTRATSSRAAVTHAVILSSA
jgi:hypothetical protein